MLNNHAMHGVLLGVGLYYFGRMSMTTSVLAGGAAAAYMMTYGHELPG